MTLRAILAVPMMLVALVLAMPAQAQPVGSYQQTCSNIAMDGDTLSATCTRFDGSTNDTTLAYAAQCVGDVGNVNGILVCTGPVGSYGLTCVNAFVEANILHATCQRRDGSWVQSTLQFQGFQGDVTNCDGVLQNGGTC